MANMEFIQFALGLKNNGTRQFLPVGELVRKGKIVDPSGCDILRRCFPEERLRKEVLAKRQQHMPFSCRDISAMVDLAVAAARTDDKKLYWHLEQSEKKRFEVVHFAHAFNGGIRINEKAETTVAGLYAAGEIAAGSHGADRIGGCMMTATQVFGHRAGHFAARRATRMKMNGAAESDAKLKESLSAEDVNEDVHAALGMIENRVKAAMEKYAGVLRTRKGLKKARLVLDTCRNQLAALQFMGAGASRKYYRVRNMAITAQLVVSSALGRGNSLGAHYRQDDARSFHGTARGMRSSFSDLRKVNDFTG